MAVTGNEPVSTADLKMACDALNGRMTALEGSVVPPLTMFPVGSVLLFLPNQSKDPGTYLGGSWQSVGASIGGTSYILWRRVG